MGFNRFYIIMKFNYYEHVQANSNETWYGTRIMFGSLNCIAYRINK